MKKQIAIRLEEEEIKKLKTYCLENDTNVQKVLEKLISDLLQNK